MFFMVDNMKISKWFREFKLIYIYNMGIVVTYLIKLYYYVTLLI